MRRWIAKFRHAGEGVVAAVRGQNSFAVHLPMATAVLLLAAGLRLEAWRWAMLLLCIGLVVSLELLNTALEILVQVLHPQQDPRVGRALDMAAGAVLVGAIAAVAAGLVILLPPLLDFFFP